MSMRAEFEKWWNEADDISNSGPWEKDAPIQFAWDAWKAAYLAGAKAMQEEAKKRCEEVSNTVHDQRMIAAIDCAEAVSAINPENLGA